MKVLKQNTLKTQTKEKEMLMQENKPWLDDSGNLRPEEEIKKLGKRWPPKVWDQYLNETSPDVRAKLHEDEKLSGDDGCGIENYSNDQAAKLFEDVNTSCVYPRLSKKLKEAVKVLTPKQRATIGLALGGFNYAEVAKKLGVSRSTVTRSVKRAVKALKVALLDSLKIKFEDANISDDELLLAITLIRGHEEEEDEITNAVEYLQGLGLTGRGLFSICPRCGLYSFSARKNRSRCHNCNYQGKKKQRKAKEKVARLNRPLWPHWPSYEVSRTVKKIDVAKIKQMQDGQGHPAMADHGV